MAPKLPNFLLSKMDQYRKRFGDRSVARLCVNITGEDGEYLAKVGDTIEVLDKQSILGRSSWLINGKFCSLSPQDYKFEGASRREHFVSLLKFISETNNQYMIVVRMCLIAQSTSVSFYSAVAKCLEQDDIDLWKSCVYALRECCALSKVMANGYHNNEKLIFDTILSKANNCKNKSLLEQFQSSWIDDFRYLHKNYFGASACIDRVQKAIKINLEGLNKKKQLPAKTGEQAPRRKEIPRPKSAPATPKKGYFSTRLPKFDSMDLDQNFKVLGKGGQAIAMLTKVKRIPQPVVAKIFMNWKEDELDAESCLKELESLSQFCLHPNIVRIFGVIQENQQSVGILMEYCADGSLADAIYDSAYRYSIRHIVRWSLDAASALVYLHENKVLHRDVKPDNMLLCHKRQLLKVSDLGWTRELPLASNSSQTRVSKMHFEYAMGTPGYIAPELCNKKRFYSKQVDVYSFGVSVWEMVNRKQPKENQWNSTGGSQHEWMNNFLASTMNQDPAKRPTMLEVYEDLERRKEE